MTQLDIFLYDFFLFIALIFGDKITVISLIIFHFSTFFTLIFSRYNFFSKGDNLLFLWQGCIIYVHIDISTYGSWQKKSMAIK